MEPKPGIYISLVIPIFNEARALTGLISTIKSQTLAPAEIIFVDGGSTDDTVTIARQLAGNDPRFRLIEAGRAMPGKGRNIGTENALYPWIAYTDAGITLHRDWLKELVKVTEENPAIDIVYGNYSPVIKNLFNKIAVLTYVPALYHGAIRGKSIATILLKKKLWEDAGGFPDYRAAEDLLFMEQAEKKGFKTGDAPLAMVYWQLRPTWVGTFKKFVLYSKHNVWAKREWDWHYGILKQYLFLLPFVVLIIFHSYWWAIGFLVWLSARTTKRILAHRYEFGLKILFNPLLFLGTSLLILTIDLATFIGWIAAHWQKDKKEMKPAL